MTAVRKELRRRRRPIGLAAMLVALTAVLVFALAASTASLPGSNFEIDGLPSGANLRVDGTPPPDGAALDWANVTEERQEDLTSGSGDNAFGQGAKEDTPVPTVVNGSIPPNKSDLTHFGVYLEENAAGRFLNLFWRRVQEPSGTTNMDFELNQSEVISGNGVTPVRTAGDVLIQYDLANGGTNPQLFLSRWVTTGAGSQCQANNAVPCWNTRVNLSASGDAIGSINLEPIPANESDGLGASSVRTFGEAQIDFDALTGGGGPSCSLFGSAYLKSRSSDSFNAELKDFIAPEPVDLDQCASVIIHKVTDPVSDPTEVQFGYTKSFDTDPDIPNTFTLGHGETFQNDDVLFGTGYTVTEDVLPSGWDFDDLDCDASVGVTPSVVDETVTFDIDDKDDVLNCTYYNIARGTIIVEKITDDGFGSFDFTSGTLTPSPFTLTTTAAGDGGKDSDTFSDLLPGSYDVAETEPAGWNLVSFTCDDGSTPLAISLQAGETVTCTAHNARERGAIDISKLRKHAADGPGEHAHPGVVFTVTGGELPAGGTQVTTLADGHACLDNLLQGSYTVVETVPAGYHNVGGTSQNATVVAEATCDAPVDDALVFHNIPLTDLLVQATGQVDGGTQSSIECVDVNGDDIGNSPVPLSDPAEMSAPDLEPGEYNCHVVIDP